MLEGRSKVQKTWTRA